MTDAIRNLAAQRLGVIKFDGARHSTTKLSGDQFAYAEIQVPNPLPEGWHGKTARISAYAALDGDPPAFKHATLTKEVGDFSPGLGNPAGTYGLTATIYVSFGVKRPNAVQVNAGDVLYFNVENRMPSFGGTSVAQSSVGPGKEADFTMDASIPS